ncbi:unnamed protein product [Miscanthus lutarioriparius]|uniref:Peptidase S59 domain-containing protein n=1 Tax=Miscanthus lutarioriparius TaxID=422564 RepID=A0A811SBG4_9POAL|nr:unnamed protein product [Miscanthus lutarioriparius]
MLEESSREQREQEQEPQLEMPHEQARAVAAAVEEKNLDGGIEEESNAGQRFVGGPGEACRPKEGWQEEDAPGGAGELVELAARGEDDEPDLSIAEHGELEGLLEQPVAALGEAFGQSSTSPFGQTSFGTPQGFGQSSTAANNPFAPKPVGSPTTTFGAQTGSSLFATTSTGAFGQQQSTPAFGTTSTGAFGQQQSTPTFGTPSSSPFGSSTPAFGASPSPAFGATSSASQDPFGSTFQQTQPTFGSSTFGSSTTPAFGTTTTPAFGTTTPAFGTTTTPAFSASTTPAFGSTSTSLFGASSTPAFGSTAFGTSSTGFGTSGTTASGVSSTTPGFGSSSTPSFGTSASAFSFGSSPSFGQTTVSSGSTPFGTTPSPFGAPAPAFGSQTAAPAFGQPQFANQAGGTRIKPYSQTPDVDSATSGTQPAAKLDSISAMPEYKDKSHEELRWEDYQRGDKGGPNTSGTPAVAPSFPSSMPQNAFASTSNPNPFNQPATNPFSTNNLFAPKPASTITSPFSTSSFNNVSVASSSPFTSSSSTTMFGQTGVSTFPAINISAISPCSNFEHILLPTCNSTRTPSQSSMVMQPAPVSNPFGTLPAMPQMSIGNGGSSPSVQYGISSLPVAEKPLPSRSLSMAVPRHLSQRRIKLLPRKYNPISDSKVPFFADDEESPARPKADAFFIPRENPRNLVIRPIEQWPSRRETDWQSTLKNATDLNKYEDVRCLDLESIVEFNNREVIVYKDDNKKPPVGEGLNKAAEVTLLNIKCVNKKTREQYCEGARVERYREMLVKKVEEQGAEFVSFDAATGEWKFRVKHFSAYGLW